jgi:hypothetical protein
LVSFSSSLTRVDEFGLTSPLLMADTIMPNYFTTFDPADTGGQFQAEQAGICCLVGSRIRRKPLIDRASSQSKRLRFFSRHFIVML